MIDTKNDNLIINAMQFLDTDCYSDEKMQRIYLVRFARNMYLYICEEQLS